MIENEVIQKFIRFCVVGGTGLVVDFGFTWLFKEKVSYSGTSLIHWDL